MNFWNEQGKIEGINAVNFDVNMHELENKAIEPYIKGCHNVLDLGCGNGLTTHYLAEKYPQISFIGIDTSKEMIQQAVRLPYLCNLDFVGMDARDIRLYHNFDAVIGKRILINIKSTVDKRKVIKNIHEVLLPRGKYIMVENLIEPLNKINGIRKSIGLNEIKVHEFNNYLDSDFIVNEFINKDEFDLCADIDFGSLYYFISRVLNASLQDPPLYDSDINKMAVKLSSEYPGLMYGLCPERMLIWEKE